MVRKRTDKGKKKEERGAPCHSTRGKVLWKPLFQFRGEKNIDHRTIRKRKGREREWTCPHGLGLPLGITNRQRVPTIESKRKGAAQLTRERKEMSPSPIWSWRNESIRVLIPCLTWNLSSQGKIESSDEVPHLTYATKWSSTATWG